MDSLLDESTKKTQECSTYDSPLLSLHGSLTKI